MGVEGMSDTLSENYSKLNKRYQEIKNQLADLEAKLAESEHRNEQLVDALNGKVFINYKLPMENAQLKQQLAEKERQLKLYVKYMQKFSIMLKFLK